MGKFSSVLPLRPDEGTRLVIAQIEHDAKQQMYAPTSKRKVKSKCKDKATRIDKKWR